MVSDLHLCRGEPAAQKLFSYKVEVLIKELKRRGVSAQKCIELIGHEGILKYAESSELRNVNKEPSETIRLNRESDSQVAKLIFDRLNPTKGQVKANSNATALIIGVSKYEKTAGAEFADKDA